MLSIEIAKSGNAHRINKHTSYANNILLDIYDRTSLNLKPTRYSQDFLVDRGYEPFRACTRCEEIKPINEFVHRDIEKYKYADSYCRQCYAERNKLNRLKHLHAMMLKVIDVYTKYGTVENKLGYDESGKAKYKLLTDKEFDQTIEHFDGCAVCNNFTTNKWYFVPFEVGGVFSKHNVIPVCDTCAKLLDTRSSTVKHNSNHISYALATSIPVIMANEQSQLYNLERAEFILDFIHKELDKILGGD